MPDATPPPEAGEPETRPPRLLIVEDCEPMSRLLSRRLRDHGYDQVMLAESAEQAQDLMWTQPVDAVICDWNLPGMNGLALLRWVRATARFAELPFLMLTMEAARANIVQAVQAGVSDYVLKPVDAQLLANKLRAHLGA